VWLTSVVKKAKKSASILCPFACARL